MVKRWCIIPLFHWVQLYKSIEDSKNTMGCSSSIVAIQKNENHQQTAQPKKETVLLEILTPNCQIESQRVQPVVEDDVGPEIMNTKMKKQKEKIQFLHQSQNFMRQSVEISNYVQQAIISLTYNPLLHDEAYYKLIGMNKKTLQKKQNRMNNLLKRQQKAEQDLKKERQKRMEKTKSEIINCRFNAKQSRKKEFNKENRDQNLYYTLSRQSFTQKISKAQLELLDSQRNIH